MLLLVAVAYADPVEVDLPNQVPARQKPSLTTKALALVWQVLIELKRDDGR